MRASLIVVIYLMMAGAISETVEINACVDAPVWQKLRVGDSVTIHCTYTKVGESAVKQLCREDGDRCKNVISTHLSDRTQLGTKFTLTDDKQKGVYTVVITTLNHEDNGTYWCAVQTNNTLTCLSRTHLHIRNRDDVPRPVNSLGGTALIKCPYPPNHVNNTKYLCKGENPFDCLALIHTTKADRDVSEGRFHIRDNKRTHFFNVHINQVTTADAGTYWCSSDRKCHRSGCEEIHLSVVENQGKNYKGGPPAQWTTAATSLHVDQAPHSGVTWALMLCLAVVILVVIAVIVLLKYRRDRLRTQGESSDVGGITEENHGDPNYEEIPALNQGSGPGDALSSVYACAGPAADQLHYASVSFQEDSVTVSTDRNAHPDKNGSLVCDYSFVVNSEYSTVQKPEEP